MKEVKVKPSENGVPPFLEETDDYDIRDISDDSGACWYECKCGEDFHSEQSAYDHIALDYQEAERREPTQEELQQYKDFLDERQGGGRETLRQCYVVVIENYKTGCPGYAGKLLIAIGDAGPEFHEVFTFTTDGELRRHTPPEHFQNHLLEGPTKIDDLGLAARLRKRAECYAVEYSPLLQSGDIDGTWGIFGGSIGYGTSTFDNRDDAQEFYEDLQNLSKDELAEKYSEFWVGE